MTTRALRDRFDEYRKRYPQFFNLPQNERHHSERLERSLSYQEGSNIAKKNLGYRNTVVPFSDEGGDKPKTVVEDRNNSWKRIRNILFCNYDDSEEENSNVEPVPVMDLFRYGTTKDKILSWIGVLLSVISGITYPFLMVLNGGLNNVFLTVPANKPDFRDQSFIYIYIFIAFGIFCSILSYAQAACFQTVCCRITAKLRCEYLRAILRQDAGWFDTNQTGVLSTRLNDNIERIREGIGEKLGLIISGISMHIAAVIIGFTYEWRITLILFCVTPFATYLMTLLSMKLDTATKNELHNVGKAGAIAEESILGVRTVQSCNGQNRMVKKYKDELLKGKLYGIQKSYWTGCLVGAFHLFVISFLGIGFFYGAYLLRVGIIENPGDLTAVVYAMLTGSYFLGLVAPHLMVLLNARAAAATIYQTIDRKPEIDAYSSEGRKLQKVEGKIRFTNVCFRYSTRKNVEVLHGMNLEIKAGEAVALVGHSGCGKSTSVGLLTRLYEAESGSVTIDGHDVKDLNIEWLRNIIGIVQQEPTLFSDTVEENLKLGNPDADMDLLIRVCKMANAHDFIMKLPKGYQTQIGEGGVQLSGGQKQRIAIARTLARDPKILLLDEATSALDAQSEAIVQNALNNASKGRTTIMIAHRLSTVRDADRIVIFDKGSIAEQGTHAQLVKAGGIYAQLIKAQVFEKEPDKSANIDLNNPDKQIAIDDRFQKNVRGSCDSKNVIQGSDAFIRASRQKNRLSKASLRFSVNYEDYRFDEPLPESKDVDEDEYKAGIMTVYKNAQGSYRDLFFGFILACCNGMLLPAMTLVNGYVFTLLKTYLKDDILIHSMGKACTMYVAIGIGVMLTQFGSTVLFGKVSENLAIRFRVEALKSVLLQDAAYFDKSEHVPGRLITRLAGDSPKVKAVIDSRAMNVLYGLSGTVINLSIAFIYNWHVASCGLIMVMLLAITLLYLAIRIRKENIQLAKNDVNGKLAVEMIENVRTIQLLTRERKFYERYKAESDKQRTAEMAKARFEVFDWAITESFEYYLLAACFTVAVNLASTHQIPITEPFIATTAALFAGFGVMATAPYFPEFLNAQSAAGSLFSIINRKPATGNYMEGSKPPLNGKIVLENVDFIYPRSSNEPVMRNLELVVNPGQTVALVGPSGCGKSTLIALMERFYDAATGSVRYDESDIKTICLHYLRTQVALVGQEPRLFAGSIKENICLGLDEEVPYDKLLSALELANAKTFVNFLPQGIDTDVGEKGTHLSGGQKQRIAIARAIVRNPKVLLLDEATSALDSEAEKAVQEALDKASKGRTCITIAHRLSSIQNADLIICIANGKVCESGNHSSLMAKRGFYYELIKQQDITA